MASGFAKHEVHDPTAAHVFAGLPAMVENVGVAATGFFEGVGKDRQVGELPLVVDGLGHFRDRAIVPGKPSAVDGDGTEGVAEQTTHPIHQTILPSTNSAHFILDLFNRYVHIVSSIGCAECCLSRPCVSL